MSTPISVNPDVSASVAKAAFRRIAKNAPKSREELRFYLHNILGIYLSEKSVSSPEATPPFEVLAKNFFEEVKHSLILGSRDSQKTLCLSTLSFLNSIFKPGCWTVYVGAVEEQSLRAKDYVSRLLRRTFGEVSHVFTGRESEEFIFGKPGGPVITSEAAKSIRFRNHSKLDTVPGTLRKVSGPHPQKAIADEVEFWDWMLLMQWWGMASEGVSGIPAQRILTSTRMQMTGTMSKLIDEASIRKLTLFQWNVFDAMAPCRTCLCKKGAIIDSTACPLWDKGCEGKAVKSGGIKSRDDVIDILYGVDDETWLTQYLCEKPSKSNIVFSKFDPVIHVTEDADYRDDKGPIFMGIDPGYADPYAIVFLQKTQAGFDVFDEMYIRQQTAVDMKGILMSGEWPGSSVKRDWLKVEYGPYGPYVSNLSAGFIDPRSPDDQIVWLRTQVTTDNRVLPSFRVYAATSVPIATRLMPVRNLLEVGKLGPGLRVHPRCTNLIWEMTVGYKYGVDRDTGVPIGDTPIDRNNHLCDALSYCIHEGVSGGMGILT